MSKNYRSDHHSLRNVAVFGGLSVISGGLFVYGLVKNGNTAVEKYETLLAVDKAGGDVDKALNDLRSYIYAHMNTEIGGPNSIYPPIQLNGTFQRLIDAENSRVEKANGSLYAEAQEYCEANGSQGFSGSNRLDCVNEYVEKNGKKPIVIEESLYKYDFVSPKWSPDLAGFSLLAMLIFGLFAIVNFMMYLRTKYLVHISN